MTGNTGTGEDYLENIKALMKDSNHEIVVEETIEAADAAAPSSQVTTMMNSGADALFAAPTGGQCPTLLMEMANKG